MKSKNKKSYFKVFKKKSLPVTISLVPGPNTTVIQFVYIAVQKPPDCF